jgi:hypothetical protein
LLVVSEGCEPGWEFGLPGALPGFGPAFNCWPLPTLKVIAASHQLSAHPDDLFHQILAYNDRATIAVG